MSLITKERAEFLINELERMRREEARILRELYGLEEAVPENELTAEEPKGSHHGSSVSSNSDDNDLKPTASHHSGDGGSETGTSSPQGPTLKPMPDCWSKPWTNVLLLERIFPKREYNGFDEEEDGTDAAVRLIRDRVLRDMKDFTVRRRHDETGAEYDALRIIDFDVNGHVTLDTMVTHQWKRLTVEERAKVMKRLLNPRIPSTSYRRVLLIESFTPSAIAAALLCDDQGATSRMGQATMYRALRIHLGSSHLGSSLMDRAFHQYYELSAIYEGLEDFRCSYETGGFTIPYFSMRSRPPAPGEGVSAQRRFGKDAYGDPQYLYEEKFTMAWVIFTSNGPRFIACLGANMSYDRQIATVLQHSLPGIIYAWEKIVAALERETSVPDSIIFEGNLPHDLLFEDANFTNSRRNFWVLQSLRIFEDNLVDFMRQLDRMLDVPEKLDGSKVTDDFRKETKDSLIDVLRRIERKRREVESLSNGLFAASSVAEARLSSEQNGNIRLLTLITIAYLPLSFATSIYGMEVLPEGTSLTSFFIVVVTLCVATYGVVFNLQLLTNFCRWCFGWFTDRTQASMQRDGDPGWQSRAERLREAGQSRRRSVPASKWLYLGYLLRYPFNRKLWRRGAGEGKKEGQGEGNGDGV